MSQSFWSNRANALFQESVSDAVQRGRELNERWKANDERRALFAQYAAALEAAKVTGEFPVEFQNTVPEDLLTRQVGVKVVALRELLKANPQHPLVKSAECRTRIAKRTLVNFNRANRPDSVDVTMFAPNEEETEQIFSTCP